MSLKTSLLILIFSSFACGTALAVGERGTAVHPTEIHIAPDGASARLATAERGHELVILETSREWLHVEALLSPPRRDSEDESEQPEARVVTGWVVGRDVIRMSTPNGDAIIYGEAVDSEDQASRSHGRRGAAQDAMRLYYRDADLFPSSPLAAQSLYRAADIRWQLDRQDASSRPSSKEREAVYREAIDDHWMKEVMKKFPGTKWADMAAFHLIDNKLCGDWQGSSKCPSKEAEIYEKYAKDYPQSPSTPEALYDAAFRWSALVEIYKTEGDEKKSELSKSKALALAQGVASQSSQGDWGARAMRLVYMLQNNVPTWGNSD